MMALVEIGFLQVAYYCHDTIHLALAEEIQRLKE